MNKEQLTKIKQLLSNPDCLKLIRDQLTFTVDKVTYAQNDVIALAKDLKLFYMPKHYTDYINFYRRTFELPLEFKYIHFVKPDKLNLYELSKVIKQAIPCYYALLKPKYIDNEVVRLTCQLPYDDITMIKYAVSYFEYQLNDTIMKLLFDVQKINMIIENH